MQKYPQTFKINFEEDVVIARQEARQFARACGLSPSDQARVSVAVSTLARNFGVSAAGHVDILLEALQGQGGGVGVQITLLCPHDVSMDQKSQNTRCNPWLYLVDELTVETRTDGVTKVTAIKWNTLGEAPAHG